MVNIKQAVIFVNAKKRAEQLSQKMTEEDHIVAVMVGPYSFPFHN